MNRLRQFLPIFTWVGIFLTPILITVLEGKHPSVDWYIANLLLVISICIVFYVNFYFIVDKYIINRQLGKFIIFNAILAFILTFVDYWGIGKILREQKTEEIMLLQNDIAFASISVALMALSISLSVSIRMTEYTYETLLKMSEVQKYQIETELSNLKSQLNPHFLFNTLNNIYALTSVNVEQAQTTIHDLSHLLRYVIYDTSVPEVPLQNEIDFLKKYIHIEQIRLDEHVDIQTSLPREEECENWHIAPLLMMPFIENAFKHGVNHKKKSFVHITINVIGNKLTCIISNSNHAKKNVASGVGIENTTKRLNLLYPQQHTLTYGLNEDNTYTSRLELTLQK